MDCEVGLAVTENSELLPPLPLEPLTVRRGEITQPLTTSNSSAKKNADLRMHVPFSARRKAIGAAFDKVCGCWQRAILFGLYLPVQVFAGKSAKSGKARTSFVKLS
jgi:hypothetical protein